MIGDTIGPYRIDRELGTGGMGKVYAATVAEAQPGLAAGQAVALKVVHPHLLETRGFFKRFLREAEIGKQVKHPNVVRTFDADALANRGEQQHFLVMEYVEGQTLRDLLEELDRVPEELCRHIGREVAKGLVAIHAAGVVHRDLKPENVLITPDHEVKVMDLGVARLTDEIIRLSQSGAFVGSVLYAAPEQFSGGGAGIDARADLYALGLTLYELTTGQHPFADEDLRAAIRRQIQQEPRPPAEINPQLSPFFEEVIRNLLAKDREERFATATDLLATLVEGEECDWWQERSKALRIETAQPLRRVRIPRETALYGRDDELARLEEAWKLAKAGDGQVVLVEGEDGIGKTRLVDELVGRLRQQGADLNFLFGSYPPGGGNATTGAFSTAYREHFGEAGLEETLKSYMTITPALIPAFSALLLGDATPAGSEPLTSDSIQTVFVHCTRALAAERPTIVLIDDLHFAVDSGREAFASLALATPGHPILLVGTTRPGLPTDWIANIERPDNAQRMTLSRLAPKDFVELLRDAFRSERLAEELGLKILTKSDGNPLFVFEIIRGLREGKYISQSDDGTWASTQVIQDIRIPSSVSDLIHGRMEDLTEEERDFLDVASCAGMEFNPGLVADAVGMGRIPALKQLGKIEKRHRLIRASGREFVFDHNQVQEALYHALPEMLREEYHAALADTLERKEAAADVDPAELDGQVAVDLCDQFLKGAQGKRALRYLDAALDHLDAGYLGESALDLVTRALAVRGLVSGESRADLLLRQEKLLDPLGRTDAQRAALDEALRIADGLSPRDEARVLERLGRHANQVAKYDEALELLARAVERARTAGERLIEARATGRSGSALTALGRYDEARVEHERHLAVAREVGDVREEASANGSLGHVLQRLGRTEEALALQERRLSLSSSIGDRTGEASAMGALGSLFRYLGRYRESREHDERRLTLAHETGDRRIEASAFSNLGVVSWEQGRFGESRNALERSVVLHRETVARNAEAVGLHNLGEMWTRLGRHDLGREHANAALEIAQDIGFRLLFAVTPSEKARGYWQEGDEPEAERLLRESESAFEELGTRDSHRATNLAYLGMFLMRGERTDEARACLDEALTIAKEASSPGAQLLAECHRALLPDGDTSAALAAYAEHEAHVEHFVRIEARWALWRATGDPTHLEDAHKLLMFVRDHGPEEARESVIENVPLHRDIVAAWNEHGSP